ncbi:unnamed protein product, partial [Laminaria digitata]
SPSPRASKTECSTERPPRGVGTPGGAVRAHYAGREGTAAPIRPASTSRLAWTVCPAPCLRRGRSTRSSGSTSATSTAWGECSACAAVSMAKTKSSPSALGCRVAGALLEGGAPLHDIQDFLGHEDLRTTTRNLRVTITAPWAADAPAHPSPG